MPPCRTRWPRRPRWPRTSPPPSTWCWDGAMAADLAPRVLAVRLDSVGDVLLTGPALRAVAAGSRRLDLLVSPGGAEAARLLPGVDDVIVFDAPWTGHPPPAV